MNVFHEELSPKDEQQCNSAALRILAKIRPQWNESEIQFQVYTVGITNKIFSAFIPSDEDRIIFRIFGKNTEQIIDRQNELVAWKKLADFGLAAPIYGQFSNGLVCGYLKGSSLTIDQIKDIKVTREVAKSMANLHERVPIDLGQKAQLFEKIYHFLAAFNPIFEDAKKQSIFEKHFPVSLSTEIASLREKIEILSEEIAFCHNDLLIHNIVLDPKTKAINFIDYEYAAPNYALFDLANHFCEWSGVDEPDYSLCPSRFEKAAFLYDYLKCRDGVVNGNRLDVILKRLPLFEAASHLFWTIWALVQSQNSLIDFDYLGYAVIRYEQYQKRLDKYVKQV